MFGGRRRAREGARLEDQGGCLMPRMFGRMGGRLTTRSRQIQEGWRAQRWAQGAMRRT